MSRHEPGRAIDADLALAVQQRAAAGDAARGDADYAVGSDSSDRDGTSATAPLLQAGELDDYLAAAAPPRIGGRQDRGGIAPSSRRQQPQPGPGLQTVEDAGSKREHRELQNAVLTKLRTFARQRQWQAALLELERLREEGVPTTAAMHNAVMHTLAVSGKWKGALELLRTLREQRGDAQVGTDIHNSALNACAKAGRWEEASELLQEMLDGADGAAAPDAISFSCAVNACYLSGRADVALGLLRACEKAARVAPNAAMYNGVMGACVRDGQHGAALALLQEMRERGVAPDELNYTTALAACAGAGWHDRAFALLAELRATPGLKPTISVYNKLLAACAKSGLWAEASEALDTMRADGVHPNLQSFICALLACRAAPLPPSAAAPALRAVALLRDMELLGVRPDAFALSVAAVVCAERGEQAHAETALDRLLRMAPGGSGGGGSSGGGAVFNAKEAGRAVTAVLKACARAALWEGALKYLHRARVAGLTAPPDGKWLLIPVIGACAAAGKPTKVIRLIEELREAGGNVSPRVLTCLVQAYAVRGEEGDWREAAELVQEMEAQFGLAPEAEALRFAVSACQAAGEGERVEPLAEKLRAMEESERVSESSEVRSKAAGE
ncbi:hypothetical protein JKP88DRAFT_349747 [Tribonema minus]|uniref:Pentacotripeptide-repeat region of PRORP domain-containing protein n=1 Tax=Tribonema minus TaxID=303371 RepID=A0A835YR48_9STRA|nr:hypothetical protein JKP88DRAFT_349747 [Tribonema minus]